MPTDVISLRLDPELREWADAYATERQVSRTALVNAAVREFRELARRGVPDLEQAPSGGPITSARPSAKESQGSDVRTPSRPAPAEDPRLAAGTSRQDRLNEAKERELARRRRAGTSLGGGGR